MSEKYLHELENISPDDIANAIQESYFEAISELELKESYKLLIEQLGTPEFFVNEFIHTMDSASDNHLKKEKKMIAKESKYKSTILKLTAIQRRIRWLYVLFIISIIFISLSVAPLLDSKRIYTTDYTESTSTYIVNSVMDDSGTIFTLLQNNEVIRSGEISKKISLELEDYWRVSQLLPAETGFYAVINQRFDNNTNIIVIQSYDDENLKSYELHKFSSNQKPLVIFDQDQFHALYIENDQLKVISGPGIQSYNNTIFTEYPNVSTALSLNGKLYIVLENLASQNNHGKYYTSEGLDNEERSYEWIISEDISIIQISNDKINLLAQKTIFLLSPDDRLPIDFQKFAPSLRLLKQRNDVILQINGGIETTKHMLEVLSVSDQVTSIFSESYVSYPPVDIDLSYDREGEIFIPHYWYDNQDLEYSHLIGLNDDMQSDSEGRMPGIYIHREVIYAYPTSENFGKRSAVVTARDGITDNVLAMLKDTMISGLTRGSFGPSYGLFLIHGDGRTIIPISDSLFLRDYFIYAFISSFSLYYYFKKERKTKVRTK